MTEFSGANDSSDFDGNTILVECGNIEEVFISRFQISELETDGKIIDYISLMGVFMCPYAWMVKKIYILHIESL